MPKKEKQYKYRKEVIRGVLNLSTSLDDSLQGVKRETVVLLARFFLVLFAVISLTIQIILKNYVSSVIFVILVLSTFLGWLGQIRKYRITKAMNELKQMTSKSEK